MFKDLFSSVAGSERSGISDFRKIIGVILLLMVGSIFLLFKTKYLEVWEVESGSMIPELEVGDRLLKISTSNYHKGDLLVFYEDDDPETPLVKRLVGVEGDKVEVENGILYVNDKQMYPTVYYNNYPMPPDNKWTIGEDELFVAGDNQRVSEDSRFFGPITTDHVDGKVIYRIGPSERRGMIYREFPPPSPDDYESSI